MPMIVPNARVVEDFSQPLVQGDGSAIVRITTYIDGVVVATRDARLSALEMQGVAESQSISGFSIGDVIGMTVLQMLSKRGDIKGVFPDNYVKYVVEPVVVEPVVEEPVLQEPAV